MKKLMSFIATLPLFVIDPVGTVMSNACARYIPCRSRKLNDHAIAFSSLSPRMARATSGRGELPGIEIDTARMRYDNQLPVINFEAGIRTDRLISPQYLRRKGGRADSDVGRKAMPRRGWIQRGYGLESVSAIEIKEDRGARKRASSHLTNRAALRL